MNTFKAALDQQMHICAFAQIERPLTGKSSPPLEFTDYQKEVLFAWVENPDYTYLDISVMANISETGIARYYQRLKEGAS